MPKQFAKRLNRSERSLYRLIDAMRSLGAPIAYSEIRCSYYYAEDGEFCIEFLKNTSEGVKNIF